nr:golgi ph regulator [Quercus suber]
MTAWLLVFWYLPQASILRRSLHDPQNNGHLESEHAFTEACLERIGIIGISLMASLSGFAAVSSLWQTFGVRHRHIRDADIDRKEAGLVATEEMLAAKQSRLRALQRRMSEAPSPTDSKGFVGRVMGSLRGGNADTHELHSLEMEVSGLDAMRYTLSAALATLHARRTAQRRARTPAGRLLQLSNTAFALYCAYRIVTTTFSALRRASSHPNTPSATTDPITRVLALVTAHWDHNLDRDSWARQISFLLSGAMLAASAGAVLQTFRLFARFAPPLRRRRATTSASASSSLPLVISQVAGAYVVSSALLLRSNLPAEVRGVISDALGAPLEPRFVESWFESWFLVAVALTAFGLFLGRKIAGADWDDHDDDDDDDGSSDDRGKGGGGGGSVAMGGKRS